MVKMRLHDGVEGTCPVGPVLSTAADLLSDLGFGSDYYGPASVTFYLRLEGAAEQKCQGPMKDGYGFDAVGALEALAESLQIYGYEVPPSGHESFDRSPGYVVFCWLSHSERKIEDVVAVLQRAAEWRSAQEQPRS